MNNIDSSIECTSFVINLFSTSPNILASNVVFKFSKLFINIKRYFPFITNLLSASSQMLQNHQNGYQVLSSVLAFHCHFWWHLLYSLIITIFASAILTIKLTFLSPCQATVFECNTALCTMLNSIWWIFQYNNVGWF